MTKPPVLLLAFANDQKSRPAYLRSLSKELDAIRSILAKAEDLGLCEAVILPNATLTNLVQTFQRERYRGRIAIFHYGGHADSYELLLEERDEGLQSVYGEGLVPFLANQNSLQLIFLNGCFSIQQAQELSDKGIPAVIGTVSAVRDDIAAELASAFYFTLSEGWPLGLSWQMAAQKLTARFGQDDLRHYYRESDVNSSREQAFKGLYNRFPWEIIYRRGAEHVANWSLPEASNRILYGLPPIPEHYDLPNTLFQFLQRYTRQEAKIFFGRNKAIKALYDRIASPSTPPLLLVYGQSGVGKSSLLEAGLLPRIEADYDVKYLRRRPEAPLAQEVCQALGMKPGEEADSSNLLTNWQSQEAQSSKKALILIIDQAEEAFTQPNPEAPQELADFLHAIELIFRNPHNRPAGKLILGYRKEYHADIEREMIRHNLPYEDYFLEKLGRKGIVEVVKGLTSQPYLL